MQYEDLDIYHIIHNLTSITKCLDQLSYKEQSPDTIFSSACVHCTWTEPIIKDPSKHGYGVFQRLKWRML